MLPAIQFDNQLSLEANEVPDKWPDRCLAAKLESVQLHVTEFAPKAFFRVGEVLAKRACAIAICGVLAHHRGSM
jgi:hypothetical protein